MAQISLGPKFGLHHHNVGGL